MEPFHAIEHEFRIGDPCPSCGEALYYDLLEVWPAERAWMFDTCCEVAHAFLVDCLDHSEALPPQERVRYQAPLRALFRDHGFDVRQAFHSDLDGSYQLDYGLRIAPVQQSVAKAFIADHHRHNPPPAGWRFGFAVFNGSDMIGVCWIGRPVARGFDPLTVLEVNRLCIRDDIPAELVWNACSMAYTHAAREGKRRGFQHIITYTRASGSGHTLKAAGWEMEAVTTGRSWNTPSRTRKAHHVEDKRRWGRRLGKAQPSPVLLLGI